MSALNDGFNYGKLNENNELEYFVPVQGGLKTTVTRRGKIVSVIIMSPTEADMNAAGWYRIVNVDSEGEDAIIDNILYHYVGETTEPTQYES